jgi:hypothetical protein
VPHQIPVVREWVETTCERIAELRPRRALEMGCGQGMIMLRCAKFCDELYIACDLSQYSVNYCKEILEKDPRFSLPHVRRLAQSLHSWHLLPGAHLLLALGAFVSSCLPHLCAGVPLAQNTSCFLGIFSSATLLIAA